MRIKLVLVPQNKSCRMPINYQYPLSAALYKILSSGSAEYSQWLHEKGYLSPKGKPTKLFVFSKLFIPQKDRKPEKNILKIFNHTKCQLFISSPMLEDFIQNFVVGLFSAQIIEIGNKDASARFFVEQVETLPTPHFKKRTKFKTISPIVVSTKRERNGRPQEHYYRASEPELSEAIRNNLINKYETVYGKPPASDQLRFEIDRDYLHFKGGDEGVSKLITIKEDDEEKATGVKCFESPFTLFGSPELMKIAYECGIGQKNSMGFGMVEVVGKN